MRFFQVELISVAIHNDRHWRSRRPHSRPQGPKSSDYPSNRANPAPEGKTGVSQHIARDVVCRDDAEFALQAKGWFPGLSFVRSSGGAGRTANPDGPAAGRAGATGILRPPLLMMQRTDALARRAVGKSLRAVMHAGAEHGLKRSMGALWGDSFGAPNDPTSNSSAVPWEAG